MISRSQLTTVLVVAMLALSMTGAALPATAQDDSGGDGTGEDERTLHTLQDGEDLYFVFGADLGDQSVEEYVDEHLESRESDASGTSSPAADIVQYQDVNQTNVDVQEGAASISIDGGDATAIQDSRQTNENTQEGEAISENQHLQDQHVEFQDVGDVYFLFGEENNQRFDGWAVAGEKGGDHDEKPDKEVEYSEATVTQLQQVDQANVNEQSVAFAIAENGSDALAIQDSSQHNVNSQSAVANAENVNPSRASGGTQVATAELDQAQDSMQTNINHQGFAVAIAIGNESTATSIQTTEQSNINEQIGSAYSASVLEATEGMNVASASTNGGSDVVESTSDKQKTPHDKKKKGSGSTDASVSQYQDVSQLNLNQQSAAVAIALNGSEATAIQISHQENHNAQIGISQALPSNAAGSSPGVLYSEETTVSLKGENSTENPIMTIDSDVGGQQKQDVAYQPDANVDQYQSLFQENLNEQHAAYAVAEDDGEATASQVSMQSQENVQFGSAIAPSAIPA
ncbi:hypothetical protein [Halostagnicola kamekurae]|uniref:Uncharacterized protein n=1 Tax=Halostagnicola kamekurae TaxID=619731 RepID=A0A1I6Q8B3_9EURY|nr:hypothetical protein [Halostagnicola kamekurae]SFS48664.1 hypothetical protein SAMN04488556_1061 [Halostagnicola kamekurae]